jgi:hypothetical protein
MDNLWVLQPTLRHTLPFVFSVQRNGLIQPGEDERRKGTLSVPFFSEEQLQRSIGAIKRRVMMDRLKGLLPSGAEPESEEQQEKE